MSAAMHLAYERTLDLRMVWNSPGGVGNVDHSKHDELVKYCIIKTQGIPGRTSEKRISCTYFSSRGNSTLWGRGEGSGSRITRYFFHVACFCHFPNLFLTVLVSLLAMAMSQWVLSTSKRKVKNRSSLWYSHCGYAWTGRSTALTPTFNVPVQS